MRRPQEPSMSAFSTAAEAKTELRRSVRRRLAALSSQELRRSDQALFDAFLALPQVREAQTVFLFWGIPGREPETEELVRTLAAQGKRVGLPRMLPERGMEVRLFQPRRALIQAAFGLWEPAPDFPLVERESIDLTLVPAVCYDRQGYRLGFGGGYYDRWLAGYAGRTVGLCRDCVLQERVPLEPHDQAVELLLTETRRFSRA